MTARNRLTLPDRSPTAARFPAPDQPTVIIPAATGRTAQTAVLGGPDNGTDSDPDDGKFSLSITQIVASTAAAVTAALIGSKLGVAGTLVGAALASIVSGVGAAIYSHSLLVTRRQMKRALLLVRPADDAPGTADDPTVLIPAMVPPITSAVRAPIRRAGRRRTVTAVLAGVAAAGVIFAGALATVTLVETVKGAPLSGGDSGLSVLGGNGSSGTSTAPSTVTVTSPAASSTAPSTVTQTVTQSPTASSRPAEQSTAPTTAPTSSSSSPAAAAVDSGGFRGRACSDHRADRTLSGRCRSR